MPARTQFLLRDAGHFVLLNPAMDGGVDPWRVDRNITITEWTFNGSVWTKVAGTASSLVARLLFIPGRDYSLLVEMTRTAGSLTPGLFAPNGNNMNGTARSASGTFTETLRANGDVRSIKLQVTAAFAGTVVRCEITPL